MPFHGESYTGRCAFENYWGEELFSYEIYHYVSDFINVEEKDMKYSKGIYLPHAATDEKAMVFSYYLNDASRLDYWKVLITTKSGLKYSSNSFIRCSIEEIDEGKVTIGVNGESKRLYISYPKSGGCSKAMGLIN